MSDLNKTNCSQVSEMLGAFRDMELELAEVEVVEEHLAKCPACRQELASIEMVVASVRSLADVPSRDFADLIEARIQAAQAASAFDSATDPATDSDHTVVAAKTGANVVPFVRPVAKPVARPRSKFIALAAVAAVALFGLVAQFALTSQGPVEVAQMPQAVQNVSQKLDTDKNSVPMTDDIVALYDEEGSGNNGSDVGISTNEDGLYAIKL